MKLNKQRQPALSREAHLSAAQRHLSRGAHLSLSPFSLLRSPGTAYCLLLLLTATFPAFAQAPDLTVCANKGYTLTSNMDATGASEVTYTWYESVNGATASTIPNSNTASYSFAAGKAEAGTYAYVRKASNAECPGGVFSNTYTVVVYAIPTITTQPAATSTCAGGTVNLSVGANNATAYQWLDNTGAAVTGGSGGQSATYTTDPLNTTTSFIVVVSNGGGACSVTSGDAVVAVYNSPVVSSVSGATVCANATAILTATVSGGTTDAMTYTWIVGSTSSTTTGNTKTTQALDTETAFTVTVTNEIGCTSAAKAGTITVTSPATSGQPVNACGCAGTLTNCSETCTAGSTYTSDDGECAACGSRWRQQRNACGTVINPTYSTYEYPRCCPNACGVTQSSYTGWVEAFKVNACSGNPCPSACCSFGYKYWTKCDYVVNYGYACYCTNMQ